MNLEEAARRTVRFLYEERELYTQIQVYSQLLKDAPFGPDMWEARKGHVTELVDGLEGALEAEQRRGPFEDVEPPAQVLRHRPLGGWRMNE